MLDHNGHLNNTRYLDFYLDVFKPEKSPKILQVEYTKQSFLGDKLKLFEYENEDKKYLYGYKDDELRFYLECTEQGE